jgi:hypothetical protein
MKIILKMNPKHHFENEIKFIPYKLTGDIKHVHQELEGLLLSKEGISKIENQFFILCYVCLKNNKMPKLALANGLWIGVAPIVLLN